MLEKLQKNSQQFMLVILAASLAMLFGTQFGPRNQGCSAEDFKGVPYIARVYGRTISQGDFQSVARFVRLNDARSSNLRRAIVDGLIERELLAHEAERIGLRVSEETLNQEIRKGFYYVTIGSRQLPSLFQMGNIETSRRWTPTYSNDESRNPGDPPPPFKYEDFERWVGNLFSRTVTDYKQDFLARELLAEQMRQVVLANVRASEDEAWRDYERNHTQVSVRYLQFSPDFYRFVVRDDDPAQVEAFARDHAEDINHQYDARRESLRGLPAQVKVRQILLRFPDDAQDPAKLATRQRAEALRARILAGEDWIRLARLYSQDDQRWREGGETMWTAVDRVDLPDDVKRVLGTLQPGQTSEVIESPLGVHIVQVVGRRQGDVSEADAKREIARELFRLVRGKELTNEATQTALTALNQPGATLDAVAASAGTAAIEAFYRGPVPPAETLPGNNPLTVVTHSDIGTPEVRETPQFTQGGSFPGVSEGGEPLVTASFALTAEHPRPAAPISVGDDRYLLQLKENGRQSASREEFNRDRLRLMDEYVAGRRRDALVQYIAQLRARAERDHELRLGNSPLMQDPRREPDPNAPTPASGSSGSSATRTADGG
jgi:parvulin-like peptidyl-prolyl isomerase